MGCGEMDSKRSSRRAELALDARKGLGVGERGEGVLEGGELSRYSGGQRSGRVLRAWPSFTKVGPRAGERVPELDGALPHVALQGACLPVGKDACRHGS